MSSLINRVGPTGTALRVMVAGLLTFSMLAGIEAVIEAPAIASSGLSVTDLNNGVTATQLATDLVGTNVSVSNVSYTGSNRAAGTFSGGSGIIGFPSGVVLGSGNVETYSTDPACSKGVEGPNVCYEPTAADPSGGPDGDDNSTEFGLPGDANLTTLAGYQTYDAAVLQFNFVPSASTVQFNYVFGSEEYDDFSNTEYNDVFAIFINGTDCALVPGTNEPVDVDNINDGNDAGDDTTPHNASLFRNNVPPTINTELDGLTTVLTCTAAVQPGVTNSIKVAIADASDDELDSAAFVQAASWPTAPVASTTYGGAGNPSSRLSSQCSVGKNGDPVNCATGDFYDTFTDFSVPGRGRPLDLTRTYNSLAAATEGPFGYGWSCSYCMSLSVAPSTGDVTIAQENGATITFVPNGSGGYVAPTWAAATLVKTGSTWTFTRLGTQVFDFSSAGLLTSESDLNGYTTTLSYNGSNQLTTVTDPAGRTLSFSYGSNGLVSQVSGPGSQSVSYGYDSSGDLTSVTDVGGGVTSFTYSSAHLLQTLTNPNGQAGGPDAGDKLTNTYNSSAQVTQQVDPAGRTTTFAYSGNNLSATGGTTTITDPAGDVTVEAYQGGELMAVTKGYGTSAAATTAYAYGTGTLGPTSVTDPNGHITSYTYDSNGDILTKTNALGDTWTYTYNPFGEVLTSQTPDQAAAAVETTYSYDANGNLLSQSAPNPNNPSSPYVTTYSYGSGCSTAGANGCYTGDVESVTSPNNNKTSYTYDAYGDVTSVTDPLGDKTTYTYNVLGQRTSMVLPQGNVTGAPTPGDIYTAAGSTSGTWGTSGDGGPATSALLNGPEGTVADAGGDIYIADEDNNRIQEVAATTHTQWGVNMTAGDVYTIAGSASGTGGTSGVGGPATSALLESPAGVALDPAGDLYIADSGYDRIEEVAATTHTQWGISMTAGDIYTVAGLGNYGVGARCPNGYGATQYYLGEPIGMAFDAEGDLYIADQGGNCVQEVATSTHTQWGISMTAGDMYTVVGSTTEGAGSSGDGGPATSALLTYPYDVTFDDSGNMYIADQGNNRVQEVAATTHTQWGTSMTANDIYTVAGSASGSAGSSGDGGPATSALLNEPFGIALDPGGDLFIADEYNNRVQEVPASNQVEGGQSLTAGDIYTVAGHATGAAGDGGDGGLATSAYFNAPSGIALGPNGSLYVADFANSQVRQVDLFSANTTTYTYNAYGDLTGQTNPLGETTVFTYDDLGNLLTETNPRGEQTRNVYDADNELSSSTAAYGTSVAAVTSYTYDGDGHQLSITDPNNKTTTYTYDPRGDLLTATDPLSHTTTYTYDLAGNQLSLTDPDGDETTYSYNNGNQLTSETQGYGTSSAVTSSYTYDPDGNQLTYTNGLSGTTTYTYDFLDRLTSSKDALGKTTTYAYDGDGNQTGLTNPDAKTTTWAYNGDDQVSSVSYSDGTTHGVTYTYTPNGLVATMADGTGTSSYLYDQAGELLSYTNGTGATVSYSYDPDGNAYALAYPNGDNVARSYDALDRLSSLTDWLGATTSFSYDSDSNLTAVTYPNGVSEANTYNTADQLGSTTDTKGTTTLASFSYTRDHDGLLTSETDTGVPGPATINYTNNALQELTAAGSSSYSYDAAQDLTQGPGGVVQSYNADGELCWSKAGGSGACSSPPIAATTYSYSGEGNLAGVTPSSGSATTYAWDEANRLKQATTGSQSVSFAYDGNSLRQSETSGSTTTHFTWDVEGALPVLLSDGSNSYIYGPSGTPVEQISSSGTPTYLLADQLGSTRALTNSSGSVTATFSYDPWGNLTGSTGSATSPFMYAGQYYDSATGLYYMQARYYDPATGQFMSLDPAVATTNSPFAYAGDDPVNSSDPSGLLTLQGDCAQQQGHWIPGTGYGGGSCIGKVQPHSLVGEVGNALGSASVQVWNSSGGEVVHYLAQHQAGIAEIAIGTTVVVVVVVGTVASGGLADAVATGAGGAASEVAEATAGEGFVGLFGLTFPLDAFVALTPVGLVGVGGLGLIGYGIYSLFSSGSHTKAPPCR
jgi:RHS repeat-associated protein